MDELAAINQPIASAPMSVLHTIEATVSVLFAFAIGLVVISYAFADIDRPSASAHFGLQLFYWGLAIAAEWTFLFFLFRSLLRGHRRPFIPEFALGQPR